MLNVQNVSKAFDTPRGPLPILDDVSMSLERGQSAAIMGPSGSGKSTLLYIIGALEPPSSGTVTLDGVNPWTLPEAKQAAFRNERVGFVFQDHLLLPQLTALENVLTPAIVRPAGVTSEIRERGRELLAQVGLAERAEHRPAELSGGERQRVAIARALVTQPACVLADEPTGNLDRSTADTVFALMIELAHKHRTAFVMVTHDQELAKRCDRVLQLVAGRLAG
jgi:lipoprotein-releasing system ATP-binding protein